ncbi:cholesterol 7-desaturase nvd [Lutzomyia longipalpis]|uniref:cholesterol 7-desaturase nvd n=1 Tax=Lutzomyia longipalpis TaxID=7200 RepID=UPI002483B110|nr:cholesterol 7-desaturase nvd [Lutzomyia longipalpis]
MGLHDSDNIRDLPAQLTEKMSFGDWNNFLIWCESALGDRLVIKYAYTLLALLAAYIFWWYFRRPINWTRNLTDIGYKHLLENKTSGHAKRDIINSHRRMRKMGIKLPPPFPNGWFCVAESTDVPPGKSISVSCLGNTFAVFRSKKTEQVFILDAYCPHLGANLGVGGMIIDDCIECPFHHWKFRGTDGQCVDIPYSCKTTIPKTAKVKSWTSFEMNGFIYIWHHSDNLTPWELPRVQEIDSKKWIYYGRNEFYINCHIQDIPENGADVSHLKAIHEAGMFAGSDLRSVRLSKWSSLGLHAWDAKWQPVTEEGLGHMAVMSLKHSFKLFNKLDIVNVDITAKQIGPGYVQLYLVSSLGVMMALQCVTPVSPFVQKVIHRFYGPDNLLFAKFVVWGETIMFERDIMVWNNKQYIDNPCLVKEDKQIKSFRNWYRQFYSDTSLEYNNFQTGLDW